MDWEEAENQEGQMRLGNKSIMGTTESESRKEAAMIKFTLCKMETRLEVLGVRREQGTRDQGEGEVSELQQRSGADTRAAVGHHVDFEVTLDNGRGGADRK